MNLNEALEYAVRLNNGRMHVSGILEEIKDKVIEEGVDASHLMEAARNAPGRYKVEGRDVILLRPERLADRVGFFREHVHGLREALRTIPHFNRLVALELALVHALAMHRTGDPPSILIKGQGLWPILDQLAEEFPGLRKELSRGLEEAWVFGRFRVEHELLLMASARLTPLEYVQELRNMVTQDATLGQFALPWSVAELMARLLGDEIKEVFDPAADASALPVVLAFNPTTKAVGVFSTPFAEFCSTLQARILGSRIEVHTERQSGDRAKYKYAHCISAPPLGGRVKLEGAVRAVEPYVLAMNEVLDRLAPGGKAVLLVPEAMLFSSARIELRKRILGQGILRAIVSLPPGVFFPYSGVKTSILVLDRATRPDAPVRFVDASHYADQVHKAQKVLKVEGVLEAFQNPDPREGVFDVLPQEIRADEDVVWVMSRFSSRLRSFRSDPVAANADVVELGSVLRDDILSLGTTEGLPFIQVAELSTDVLDARRSAKDGGQSGAALPKTARRLDAHALLLARVGGKLKPTMFDPADGPVAVGSNVFIFSVDASRADPEYLVMELRSSTVQDQLDAYHQGSTIPSIAKVDLMRMGIRLPDLQEQRRLVRERKEAILLAKREEIARQEKRHGLSTDEWRILGAVEHSFRPVLAMVEQPMEAIRSIVADIATDQQMAVRAELTKIDSGLDRMRGLFKLINDIIRSDKDSLRRVPVDLRRLFRAEVRGLAKDLKAMRIYFQCEAGLESAEGVIARLDPQQFSLVVQNLFTNMAKHARSPEMDELTVLVHVSSRTEPGRTWLVITVENDGRPFAPGFTHNDFITFGKRLDDTNGNGIGGFLIDRIVANHNGRFSSGNLDPGEGSERSGFAREQRLDDNHWEPIDWELVSTNMHVQFMIELPIDHANDHA